jgi:hypothetical protein
MDDRPANRPSELVLVVRVFLVLDVADSLVVDRIEVQPFHRRRREWTSLEVVVSFALHDVAAALGDRADDAAERATVLRRDATCLDLHFLQVFEDRVLARAAVHEAVGRHAVDGERVLGAAGAVHLDAALDVAGIDRGRREREVLEAAAFRDAIDLLGRDVVGDRRVLGVDERRFRGDAHLFLHASDLERRIHRQGLAEQQHHVGRFAGLEAREVELDGVASGLEVQHAVDAVGAGHGGVDLAGFLVRDGDGRARQHGAAGVLDIAGEAAESFLRPRRGRCQCE